MIIIKYEDQTFLNHIKKAKSQMNNGEPRSLIDILRSPIDDGNDGQIDRITFPIRR